MAHFDKRTTTDQLIQLEQKSIQPWAKDTFLLEQIGLILKANLGILKLPIILLFKSQN